MGGRAAQLLCSWRCALNALVLCTYACVHLKARGTHVAANPLAWLSGSRLHTQTFDRAELQFGIAFVAASLIHCYTSPSLDASVASVTRYGQLFVLVMALLVDTALFATYAAAFGAIALLAPHPWPRPPQGGSVQALTAASFYASCLNDSSALNAGRSAGADGLTHVVYFYTEWSDRCRQSFATFADLAARFSTEQLKFAKLDVGMWPGAARVIDMDTSCVSSQLPTVACFEGGKEVARVPHGSSAAAARDGGKYRAFTRMDLITGLGLDIKKAATMLPARGAGGGASGGAASTSGAGSGS